MKYEGRDNLDIMSLAKNYNNYIFNWISEVKSNKILDFGAGNGEYCNRFNKNDITAIEIDDSLRESINCNSFSSIEELTNNRFNLIYSLNVLEHIENDGAIVVGFDSLLESKGIIKILVPARQELFSQMDINVGHFRRYDIKKLQVLFDNNKYEITECKYFDFLGYFATLAYKLIDNSGEIDSKSLIIYDKFIFPVSVFFDKITFGKIIGKNIMLTLRKK